MPIKWQGGFGIRGPEVQSNWLKFILHSNSISERGDGVALLELALALTKKAIPVKVVYWGASSLNSSRRLAEFICAGIECIPYNSREDLEVIAREFECTHFLAFSDGSRTGSAYCATEPNNYRIGDCFHITWVVFRLWEPHGDLYLYVSRWNYRANLLKRLGASVSRLSGKSSHTKVSYLDHFLACKESSGDKLRSKLGIPEGAFVIGRIGGKDQFNDPVAQCAIERILERRKDVYFLFANTEEFIEHPRVLFLDELSRPQVWELYSASQLMLNARMMGESFGLGIVEAMQMGKPIIAPHWVRNPRMDKNHIVLLRGLGLLYLSENHLVKLILRQLRNPVKAERLRRRVKHTRPEYGIERLLRLIPIPSSLQLEEKARSILAGRHGVS